MQLYLHNHAERYIKFSEQVQHLSFEVSATKHMTQVATACSQNALLIDCDKLEYCHVKLQCMVGTSNVQCDYLVDELVVNNVCRNAPGQTTMARHESSTVIAQLAACPSRQLAPHAPGSP